MSSASARRGFAVFLLACLLLLHVYLSSFLTVFKFKFKFELELELELLTVWKNREKTLLFRKSARTRASSSTTTSKDATLAEVQSEAQHDRESKK